MIVWKSFSLLDALAKFNAVLHFCLVKKVVEQIMFNSVFLKTALAVNQ